MPNASMFRPGFYKHHKGGLYRALFLAHDSTNTSPKPGQHLVVYISCAPQGEHTEHTGQLNVRALDEWWELIQWPNGEMKPRFTWERE